MLTNEQFDELDALLAKATKGVWTYNGNEIVSTLDPRCGIAGAYRDEDAQAIAALVTAWPEIKAMRDELSAVEKLFYQAAAMTPAQYREMMESL